ncbi:MAG: hypothetical protein HZB25_10535 [Candidatus Eisenbacteria bacterium]|nr:hypothetical protein [Candidatus Eisenbacteria bacterium]
MRRSAFRVALLMVCLLGLACASPEKLTRQSEEALAGGDANTAYEKARKALDKEPAGERAHQAMTAAAAKLMEGWRREITTLASADTLSAGLRCRDLDAFRRELSEYRVSLPTDNDFARDERAIRGGAADIYYRRGTAELADRRPRKAYDDFLVARDIFPGFRDVESLIRQAYNNAVSHVALLPFANETDVRGLSMEISDRVYGEVVRRITQKDFRFTVLIDREQVYQQVPVSSLSHLSREEAVRIGRKLGADVVICGRFHSVDATTNNDSFRQPVARHETFRDESGATSDRFVEDLMEVLLRHRTVSVGCDVEALDTGDGAILERDASTARAEARTIYTQYVPRDDVDSYALYAPELKKTEPEKARTIEKNWKEKVGTWKLPELLTHAKKEQERSAWKPAFRSEFYSETRNHPVFLGDLPPVGDLAFIALDDTWQPVLSMLRSLERGP